MNNDKGRFYSQWIRTDYNHYRQNVQQLPRGTYIPKNVRHVELIALRKKVWVEMRDFLNIDERYFLADMLGKQRVL